MAACNHRRALTAIIVACVVAVAVGVYASFDPSTNFFPRCPIYVMTGLQCPGCGAQRCLHALLNAQWVEAWHYNAMLLILTPVLLLMIFSELYRTRFPRLYRAMTSTPMVIALLALLLLWTVARNLN